MESDVNQNVLKWIDMHYQGRPYKPNRQALASFLIRELDLNSIDKVEQAYFDRRLDEAAENFVLKMRETLSRVNKGKVL